MIIDPEWLLVPAFFTGDQCDRLIDLAKSVQSMAGDMTLKPKMPDQPEIRSSTLRWLHRMDGRFDWVFAAADALMERAEAHFETKTIPFDAFQFTEYHACRRGQYDWHQDYFPTKNLAVDRRLSLCIQLSAPDTYAGGQFELRDVNPLPVAMMRRRGAAVVFRSSTWHRVLPTVWGARYSAVAWRSGPM